MEKKPSPRGMIRRASKPSQLRIAPTRGPVMSHDPHPAWEASPVGRTCVRQIEARLPSERRPGLNVADKNGGFHPARQCFPPSRARHRQRASKGNDGTGRGPGGRGSGCKPVGPREWRVLECPPSSAVDLAAFLARCESVAISATEGRARTQRPPAIRAILGDNVEREEIMLWDRDGGHIQRHTNRESHERGEETV